MSNKKYAILISGASSGIGKECAMQLSKAGFRVFAGVRSKKAVVELKKEMPENLNTIILDVTDNRTIENTRKILRSENLYGIVNNAGIAVLGPLEFVPVEEIRHQFEVNLFGHIAITKALLPFLRRSGKGRIINMSSISSQIAFPFFGPYAASKFALEAFNDALRRELKQWNLQVISIQPGNIRTAIWQKSLLNAEALSGEFPLETKSLYKLDSINSDKNMTDMTEPSAVSAVVLKALTDRRPKTHYRVGMDSYKYFFMNRLFPASLLDRLIG
jgi:short-subunit dehydrogenase